MKKNIPFIKKIKAVETIKRFCNKCQKSLNVQIGEVEVKIYQGYGSLWDGELHEFDLCNKCYKKFIDSFKMSISVIHDEDV